MGTFLELILLSIIQGLTEVFPISSSGHVALVQTFFEGQFESLSFLYFLHIGSLVAIIAWFSQDLKSFWYTMFYGFETANSSYPYVTQGTKLLRFLLICCLATAVVGWFMQGFAQTILDNHLLLTLFLFLNGVIIILTVYRTRGEFGIGDLTVWDFVLIGAVQGAAVVPGISRLGLTICICLWRRLKWYEAVRLAFLLAIPTTAGGILFGLFENDKPVNFMLVLSILLSTVVIGGITWLGLKIFTRRILERKALLFFGEYCCLLGIFMLALFLSNIIKVAN